MNVLKIKVPSYLNLLWLKFTSTDASCDSSPIQGYKEPFKFSSESFWNAIPYNVLYCKTLNTYLLILKIYIGIKLIT